MPRGTYVGETVVCHDVLDAVSLVPVGAYKGAEVLALREPVVQLPRLAPLPDELAESLAGRGFYLGNEADTSAPAE